MGRDREQNLGIWKFIDRNSSGQGITPFANYLARKHVSVYFRLLTRESRYYRLIFSQKSVRLQSAA